MMTSKPSLPKYDEPVDSDEKHDDPDGVQDDC